ncbi:fumarate hydratase [bacterium]|nr:fumarate hydratase [bacterium]
MKQIHVRDISGAVKNLCIEANTCLGEDVLNRLRECRDRESSAIGRQVLSQIVRNADMARDEAMPMCQDTGVAVVFVELGQEVHIQGGNLTDAIQEGVSEGYRQGYLRKSMVRDPFDRVNTGDNTPAVIHLETVPGDLLRLTVAPKGGGSENMSTVVMLPPSAGLDGVREFVLNWVERAGANPCPPVIVGVGIGGNFEHCAYLAKKSLLRDIGDRHPDPFYAALEIQLLEAVNTLGIGPQGFGGDCTALEVFIETAPCHIASLPVAVNLQCHAARHRQAVL